MFKNYYWNLLKIFKLLLKNLQIKNPHAHFLKIRKLSF